MKNIDLRSKRRLEFGALDEPLLNYMYNMTIRIVRRLEVVNSGTKSDE